MGFNSGFKGLNTGCIFYGIPEHNAYQGMSLRTHIF